MASSSGLSPPSIRPPARRPPSRVESSLELLLLGGRDRRPERLPQGSGRPRQAERAFGPRLSDRGSSERFEQPGNASLVSQVLEDLHALLVERLRSDEISLVSSQVTEVRQGSRDAPLVSE